jgi:trimeric autotransporter adhesin
MRIPLLRIGLLFLFLGHLGSSGFAQPGVITTYAGARVLVDGAQAATQTIDGPVSVVSDGEGGFYVASENQYRVFHVAADGRIYLVAGNGIRGFSGDDGPATMAQLGFASGVAVDSAGNLFIADFGNNRIRKVTPSGIISTVAGNGVRGFSGDGGPAASAQLTSPGSVAMDSAGNLFIADYGNSRIRKVTPSGIISTVAGNGNRGFSGDGGSATAASIYGPSAIAVDLTGNLYLADETENRIRRVSPDGVIRTVAGSGIRGFSGDGGLATEAQLAGPQGIAVDLVGNLYIADSVNCRIRKLTPDGMISTVAGKGEYALALGDGGPATSAGLNGPQAVAVDLAGNLYIADTLNNRIRKVTSVDVITTVAGDGSFGASFYGGDGGPAFSAHLYDPNGVAVDSAGNLFIADTGNSRIRKVTPAEMIITAIGNEVTGAWIAWPNGVTVDSAGNLYIASTFHGMDPISRTTYYEGWIFKANADGVINSQIIIKNDWLYGISVDSTGNLYIADGSANKILKVSPDGMISTVAGNGTSGFAGNGGPATSAELNGPKGVAVDSAGNLYIADTGNNTIRKVTPAGVIVAVAGNGTQGCRGDFGPAALAELYGPNGVAVDSAGNLFIADTGNNRIRKVTPAGVIMTIAGNGTQGFGGDGGLATNASLRGPTSVAFDSAGNLYIADAGNNRIRKVTPIEVFSPVYRFYNNDTGSHFYTISEAEKDLILQTLPQFIFEGSGFYAFQLPQNGAMPVYRFYNLSTGYHFYTISSEEKDYIIGTLPQFLFEGPAFYVPAPVAYGAMPVYRFYDLNTDSHFYTISEAEKDDIISSNPQMVFEGVAFYCYPNPL